MYDHRPLGNYRAVSIALAVLEHYYVAWQGLTAFIRPFDPNTEGLDPAQVSFGVLMQVPLAWIRPRVKGPCHKGIHEHPDQQHPTVRADTFQVRPIAVWRADP